MQPEDYNAYMEDRSVWSYSYSFEILEEIQKKETQSDREFANDLATLLEIWTDKMNSLQKGSNDMNSEDKKKTSLNTSFYPIEVEKWERRQYFYYFTKMLPTGFSTSVEVDITNTYNMIKKQNRKFFPAYLYLTSKLISEQQEFRIANLDGQLGYYEVLHPSYACFHQDDKTMSNMWTEYVPNFEDFYINYMEDQAKYANNHGILGKLVMPPSNNCMIGMLPWIQFTSYSPVPYVNSEYYFPIIQAGKFFDREGKKMMPFSITVHHAVADGYHVGLFLEKFRREMAHPENWINK